MLFSGNRVRYGVGRRRDTVCCSESWISTTYGVVLVSRIDEIIGLFCKRALSKRLRVLFRELDKHYVWGGFG